MLKRDRETDEEEGERHMFTVFTIFVVVVGYILIRVVIIVPMRQHCLLERLGNFRAVLEPGLHIVIPFIDRIAYQQEIRYLRFLLLSLGTFSSAWSSSCPCASTVY
jgi:regulator of protease activity HflC (stomatin/prohibitin superfamily)